MKKILYILTFVLLSACTIDSDSRDGDKLDTDAIKLSTGRIDASKGVVTTGTVFKEGNQMGVFQTQQNLESNTPANASDLLASDYGYTFGLPYWSPVDALKQLTYPSDKVTKIFAYYPFTGYATTAPVVDLTVNNSTAMLNFNVPVNQTSTEVLNKADLLYANATGENQAGLINKGEPINLIFNHVLTRFGFSVKIKESKLADYVQKTFYLRRVEIVGEHIYKGLTLNLFDGTIKASTATTTIFWSGFAAGEGLELKTGNTNGQTGAATEMQESLLVPFIQTNKTNKVVFYISETNEDFSGKGLEQLIKENKIFDYMWEIPVPETDKFKFDKGVFNQVSATIELADKVVSITATIEPWIVNDDTNTVPVE